MERFSLELEATEVFYGKNQSCRACRDESIGIGASACITRGITLYHCSLRRAVTVDELRAIIGIDSASTLQI